MGKSFLLNNMAFNIKEKYKNHWIILVNLNQYSAFLNKHPNSFFKDQSSVISFLGREVLKIENDSEFKLLSDALLRTGKCQVLFDGIDEIAPLYTEKVIDMLKTCMKMNIRRIFISTRKEFEEKLQDLTQKIHYCLTKFDESDQKTYLINYWRAKIEDLEGGRSPDQVNFNIILLWDIVGNFDRGVRFWHHFL
jgi:hypothetical protein